MTKTLLLAVSLIAVSPGLALAFCSGQSHEQVTMSCPEGQSFDALTQTCKAITTG